jgi:hypothetical protein
MYPNWDFCFEKTPSGNPAGHARRGAESLFSSFFDKALHILLQLPDDRVGNKRSESIFFLVF